MYEHVEGVPEAREPNLPSRIVGLLRRDAPLAVLDLGIVFFAYLGPLVLRFEGSVPGRYWDAFWKFLPLVAVAHLLANYLFGLYGQMWRYASVQEARRVVLAGASGGLIVVVLSLTLNDGLRPVPLSVVLLGATLCLVATGALRFQARLFAFKRRTALDQPSRALLVGAGDAGAMLLRDLLRHPWVGLEPVAFLDDDPRKQGRSIHGVPVVGDRSALPRLVEELQIEQVLIAVPSAPGELVRDVASDCERAGVAVRLLPSMEEMMGGRITARDVRDLRIEDLLGRRQVEVDLRSVAGMLRDRRVLVTGAGGSIGAEIARQVAGFSPASLVLLDNDETHLHDAVIDLKGYEEVVSVLADIRDRDRLVTVFDTHRPEVVFHAAAHKHVPILEDHPEEALATNVLGTANVADAALAAGVERFVLISTDKAVKPASVMGASKRLAEQIIRSRLGNGCTLCSVRFGNVLGSRGSVIPTFMRQIAGGGPVTVTDPSMARYFMSTQEAVRLVLQAAALAEGGEVFTLEMGEPMNILELARKLIRLSGRIPDTEVPIDVVGPRPGEKIVEEIIDLDEAPEASAHPGIMVSRPGPTDRSALRKALNELEWLSAEGRSGDLAARIVEVSGEVAAPVEEAAHT